MTQRKRDPETNAAYSRKWRRENPERSAEIHKRWRDKLKHRVLVAYGGEPPSCICCGEAEEIFLTIDHVEGGGNAARRTEGHRGGTSQYVKLVRDGFPTGYRVLCWNCNFAWHVLGTCPHNEKGAT